MTVETVGKNNTKIEDLFLGKAPPLRYPEAIEVKLADYVDLKRLPTPPKTLPALSKNIKYGMFLNDSLGDCTCASFGHKFQIDSTRTGQQENVGDSAVMELYHNTGLEQGLSDNDGRYMEGVASYMKRVGIRNPQGGYDKVLGYASVNWLDDLEWYTAIWLFGGVYTGIALPTSAYYQRRAGHSWGVTASDGGDTTPGSWGGHAVFVTNKTTLATWASLQVFTTAFRKRYFDEGLAILTEEWVEKAGKAPNGFARDELIRDLGQI